HRMAGPSFVAGAQFRTPPAQEFQRMLNIPDFVPQIIGPAAVGIDIVEMLVQPPRKEPRNHGKVFVMRRRQPPAIGLGLGLCRPATAPRLRPPDSQLFRESCRQTLTIERTRSTSTRRDSFVSHDL